MKILFTKSEYRTLLDMVYMAEWMLTAYDDPENPEKEQYAHLAQKIYSHAKEMGWESLVRASAAENTYAPTREYEEGGVHDLIEAYDAEAFWDQLVDRMTERDVAARLDPKDLDRLSDQEYDELAAPLADAYEREFDNHGLDRLKISES